jgi:uncharacterized circularly permuted ATP-grasp superfamily protein
VVKCEDCDQHGVDRERRPSGERRRTPEDDQVGKRADAQGRGEWADRLGTGPDGYVVEEFLPLSHAPVWHEDCLESRALMLRVFLLTDGRGDYQLMPGGLSRIAGADRQIVSGQRGGSSKDTWILSDVPVERRCPSNAAPPVGRSRTS